MSSAPIETHAARNPRLLAFYGLVALLVLVLIAGVGYQQLFQSWKNSEEERKQSQRRIIVPGPRGNIYDRHGRLLVENRARFSVVLNLADLRGELRTEYRRVLENYRKFPKEERPTGGQLERIARQAVAQRYLDQVNAILGRREQVRPRDLDRHFNQTLLLPYVLLDDLSPEEYARLVERLPVNSPLQVYASSTRHYPYGNAAAHVLGYVGIDTDPEAEELGNDDLMTFKMKGTFGRDGLEKQFDSTLQGQAGGAIYRVDPAGYKINPPLEKRTPKQGQNLTTSLDIDLQLAAEDAIGDRTGAAIALDVRTGEVLVMASKPDYDLNKFVPRLSAETAKEINDKGAWLNQAVNGLYPPGSTFKILTTIAALRRAAIVPDRPIIYCDGTLQIGNRTFYCDNGHKHHGNITLAEAIAQSCDIYYYEAGRLTTADGIAEEARRFGFGRRTGIEVPFETGGMLVPDPKWKKERIKENWFPGDTANYSIGQGYLLVTPLEMACFAASVARNETTTVPTLLHRPDAPPQHSEPIGLSEHERETLLEGMEGTTTHGTAYVLTQLAAYRTGIPIAGKTGTAQKRVTIDGQTGNINYAWFICFAPVEKPEIAIAVVLQGDTIGETFGGGLNAAPVANQIVRKYFEKKNAPAVPKPEFKLR